jgi:type I restriction enzyme, S subunit
MKVEKLLDVVQIKNPKPEKFSGEKRYYSTGNIDEYDVSENFEIVKFDNRPSRANVQPIENSVGFAKMKSTAKTLLVTKNHSECIFSTGMNFLLPSKNIISKYLYYYLISPYFFDLKDKYSGQGIMGGLSNKDLNLFKIPVPSLHEQEKIVERLDSFFNAYSKKIASNETESKHYEKLKNKYIFNIIKSGSSKTHILHEVLEKLYAGGDKPSDISVDANHTYKYPIYANAVKNDGLIGYSKTFREDKPAITIAGRGSGTGHVLKRNGSFLPIVRLITAVPDTSIVDIDYLELVFFDMKTKITGSAIPQLTIPNLKNMEIKVPTLEEQSEIVLKINKLKLVLGNLKDTKKRQNSLLENLKLSYLDKEFSYE